MKSIFITWGREAEHSRLLAEALGFDFKKIFINNIGYIKIPVILRYFLQSLQTIYVLLIKRPSVVIAQNPPVFLVGIVFFYKILFGKKLAIDSHTAAFYDKKWIFFHWLFKFFARRADVNTCHNFKNLEVLKEWGANNPMVMRPTLPQYHEDFSKDLKNDDLRIAVSNSSMPIMMVNRFASDDDWRVVIEMAKIMPEATFFITGDNKTANGKAARAVAPNNVYFTGYLQHEEFMKLMSRARVILSLTLRRDTVLWSIGEAAFLGKPVITTDSEVLREYFSSFTFFADHNPQNIKNNILEALNNNYDFRARADKFLGEYKEKWNEEIGRLKKNLLK